MKRILIILSAIIVVGCTGNNKPETTPVSPKGMAPMPPKATSSAKEPTLSPLYNPNRIYQLDSLQKVEIKIGKVTFSDTWVADTDSKRQEGLMWVRDRDMTDSSAMVFLFKDAEPQSFWMENTMIPLDIAYFDANCRLLNIQHGEPRNQKGLPSNGAAKYVVEVKGGLMSKLGIKTGDKLTIPSGVAAVE